MRAAVTAGPGAIALEERSHPGPPTPGQTLLRVEVVGICGSDLHLLAGDLGDTHQGLLPRVQGHEFSALVEVADPAGGGPPPGARVAVWPVLACGECRPCRDGRTNVCARLQLLGVHRDGALQELLLAPTTSLVPTPQLEPTQAAVVEPMSIGVHAVNRGRLTAGESVVVLGGGPIGVGCAVAARDLGAAVLVVDPVGSRWELLAGCGFATVPTAGDVAAHPVLAAGAPEGPDVVIDTTGRAPVLATALELAGHGGRVVVVGMTAAAAPTSPGLLPIKELDVLGSSCCLLEEFAAAADLVARNRAVADALVSHVVPLDRVADAFELLEHRPTEAVKVLIDLTGTAPLTRRGTPQP